MTHSSGSNRRRRTFEAGHRGETLAVLRLILSGHRILARRYAVAGGEIDIIAKKGSVIAFVEVKLRPSLSEAAVSITPQKQRRIGRAAAVWLARNPWASSFSFRADAIFVVPRRWPRHVPEIFTLDL